MSIYSYLNTKLQAQGGLALSNEWANFLLTPVRAFGGRSVKVLNNGILVQPQSRDFRVIALLMIPLIAGAVFAGAKGFAIVAMAYAGVTALGAGARYRSLNDWEVKAAWGQLHAFDKGTTGVRQRPDIVNRILNQTDAFMTCCNRLRGLEYKEGWNVDLLISNCLTDQPFTYQELWEMDKEGMGQALKTAGMEEATIGELKQAWAEAKKNIEKLIESATPSHVNRYDLLMKLFGDLKGCGSKGDAEKVLKVGKELMNLIDELRDPVEEGEDRYLDLGEEKHKALITARDEALEKLRQLGRYSNAFETWNIRCVKRFVDPINALAQSLHQLDQTSARQWAQLNSLRPNSNPFKAFGALTESEKSALSNYLGEEWARFETNYQAVVKQFRELGLADEFGIAVE